MLAYLRIWYQWLDSRPVVELVVSYLHLGLRTELVDPYYGANSVKSIERFLHGSERILDQRPESILPLCVYGLHNQQFAKVLTADHYAHYIYLCGCQPREVVKLSLSEKEFLRQAHWQVGSETMTGKALLESLSSPSGSAGVVENATIRLDLQV